MFDYDTGIEFKKTGREIKVAITERLAELRGRLEKRDRELEEVMDQKPVLRSYLVRHDRNDYPHSSQLKAEMPTEEHQRITELCRRINLIETELTKLSVIRDNLRDEQELELSYNDLTKLGFSPEHFKAPLM